MHDDAAAETSTNDTSRRWLLWLTLLWLVVAALMLADRWNAIRWFSLGDTDDNVRFAQVRDLLAGQGWYDLRQYALDPPRGANIHWSRLVDLPIAAIILIVKPWFGTVIANKAAVALAPMIPLWIALLGAALAARRLIAPAAWPLAAAVVLCGQSALLMWMPLRIDHHGWQLAMLILAVAGFADPRRVRGGLTIALASAVSLAIGLEMLPYIGMTGAAIVLRWVWDEDEAAGLTAYALGLAAGTTAAFLVFASNDNWHPVCDALSPVWLSVALLGSALAAALARIKAGRWQKRLALALGAGAVIAVFYVLVWPKCTGQLEGMSPELKRLWFNNVREAKPIYRHSWRIGLAIVALPVMGLIGAGIATWRARATPLFSAWACAALFALFSCLLLLWQTRAGPSAQLLAVPGATALAWMILPRLFGHRLMIVRVLGTTAAFILISGLYMFFALRLFPEAPKAPGRRQPPDRSRYCATLPALRPIARMPAATMLTFVDFGPRLIATTHHRAIAGPYHRNGAAIIDIHHAFRGTAETAHEVMLRHGATLVLICPGMAESTIYAARAKQGFYMQLRRGQLPDWLERVALPADSPFRLYRLRQSSP